VDAQVFISYSRDDEAFVKRLIAHLRSAEVEVWHDGGIDYGDEWIPTIQRKIDTCAAFVVVMTPAAERSRWVRREINQAEQSDRPIMPLLLAGRVFFELSEKHYDDVRRQRLPSAEFVERIRGLVGERPSTERANVPVAHRSSLARLSGLRGRWQDRRLRAATSIVVVALMALIGTVGWRQYQDGAGRQASRAGQTGTGSPSQPGSSSNVDCGPPDVPVPAGMRISILICRGRYAFVRYSGDVNVKGTQSEILEATEQGWSVRATGSATHGTLTRADLEQAGLIPDEVMALFPEAGIF
jgi:hypothetical protein